MSDLVLDLSPHDVNRAIEALAESRGMIAMEVAVKLRAAADLAGFPRE